MFGYSSYLDKSMNGIKTISDGVALIQNGNATFNTINVETITSSNLTDCNLNNCTTNDPTTPQSVANKEYVDDNFVDRTNNLTQDINGIKTFLSIPLCATNASINSHLTNKSFTDATYVDFLSDQTITGTKRFNTIFTGDHSWRDVGSPFTNRVQSYITGNYLVFMPQIALFQMAMAAMKFLK
jgi:hypothetical protein